MLNVWQYKNPDNYKLSVDRGNNDYRARAHIQEEKERIIVRTKKIKDEFTEKLKEDKKKNLKLLNKEEKIVYGILIKERSMFQADLVEKSGFSKVKVTRILDRLEGKNLVERKRRGMSNIVILR